jgi:hypothetical protein
MMEQGAETGHWAGARDVAGRTWAKVLFVVVLVGLGLIQGYHLADVPDTPVAYEQGRLVATDRLENALHDPATGARVGGPAAGAPFANAAGERCRRFVDGEVRGVACQQEGDWRIVELRQGAADPDAGAAVAPGPAEVPAGEGENAAAIGNSG